jgi:SH3-like domain-containing protein
MKQFILGVAVLLATIGGIRMAGAQDVQPRPRPERPVETPVAAVETAAVTPAPQPSQAPQPARDPSKGAVTNLPIPRYVSLKTNEGNARRGPSLTHRIDWVFTHAGMPLRITAEYEHWRRIEDLDGAGGWIHYSLLSGVRTVMVVEDMVELRAKADRESEAVAQAERGVIGKVIECSVEWCRISAGGEKGWLRKTSLWGVDPEEIIE